MPITVVLGEQRGDEGKGRFAHMEMDNFDIGARFGGGNNAGHTVVSSEGIVYKLHSLPSSILHECKKSVIGNGTVIDASKINQEMNSLRDQGVEITEENLLISGGTHMVLPHHVQEDEKKEKSQQAQGSTKSGIGPVYGSKAERTGLRAEIIKNDPDALTEVAYQGLRNCRGPVSKRLGRGSREDKATAEQYTDQAKKLGKFVTDTALYLNKELKKDSKVLAEGAQAYLLDIDHGMYPYVTSSSTVAGGVATGLGVSPKYIDNVIGVSKAVQSHVGGGPFVTEIDDPDLLRSLHGDESSVDAEKGTTTGRKRRLGYLDLPQIKRAQMINGTNEMAITKLDWLPRFGSNIPICIAYERKGKVLEIAPDAAYKLEQAKPFYDYLPSWKEDISQVRKFPDLPKEAKDFILFIETHTGLPITLIGIGPQRDQVIDRR